MINSSQKLHFNIFTLLHNSKFLQLTVSPLLAIALSLTSIYPSKSQNSPPLVTSQSINTGNQITVNGRVLSGVWLQQLGHWR